MEDVMYEENKETIFIPSACRYENLGSDSKDESVDNEDTNWLMNEDINWLTERNGLLPLWSRLYTVNCVGELRGVAFEKESNYEMELPGRILSMFSNSFLPTPGIDMKLKKLENYQLISNVLALCSALKYNFRDWSQNFLDTLMETPVIQYPKILKKLGMKDEDFRMEHLNQSYIFKGDEFQVKIRQAITGSIYIPWDEFNDNYNLSRALHWFFDNYQFGLIKCCNHTLAFGHALDTDYGFFMYDCQSQGHPLFKEYQANSYILRANHLQSLLYCLIITLNVTTENIKFSLYCVDIKILNPIETVVFGKESYVPTIKDATKTYSGSTKEWTSNESNDDSFFNVSKRTNSKHYTNNTNNRISGSRDKTKNCNSENKSFVNDSKGINKNNNKNNTSRRTLESIDKNLENDKSVVIDSKDINNNNNTNNTSEKTLDSRDNTKACNFENVKTPAQNQKLFLDSDKMYYIVAVPKKSNPILEKANSTQSPCSKVYCSQKFESPSIEDTENLTVNIHRLTTLKSADNDSQTNGKFIQECTTETINLITAASTETLIPITAEEPAAQSPSALGLKVYMINNSTDSTESSSKIQTALKLRDLLT